MSKVEEKKLEKYRKLLDAAYELAEHKELVSISIDEIVGRAGVAKGTFYLYFKDKYDLISKIILDRVCKFMNEERLKKHSLPPSAPIKEHIELLVGEVMKFLKSNMTLTKLIDKNVHTCVNAVIENRNGDFAEIYELIADGLRNLGYTAEEVNAKLYLMFDMIVSSCCNALIRKNPLSPDRVCSQLTDIITCFYTGASLYKKSTEVAI